jgi:hypothetical protein
VIGDDNDDEQFDDMGEADVDEEVLPLPLPLIG